MFGKTSKMVISLVLALAILVSAFYFNFSRTSAQTAGPAMLGVNGMESRAPEKITYDIGPVEVGEPVKAASFDKDLRTLPQIGPDVKKPMREMLGPSEGGLQVAPTGDVVDPVLQVGGLNETLAMPATLANFAGLDLQNWGAGWPPDTHGAVGPNHYIQAVNTSMAVYDKTGNRLAAFKMNGTAFFTGTGTACDSKGQGDPIVLYDTYSGRFIVTQFAWSSTRGPFYECIAVAKTADPVAGGWWFYGLQVSSTALGDYPKFGVWPDGIYMGASMFTRATKYSGAKVWALNRSDMISGAPLRNVAFTLGTAYFSVFPSTSFVYNGAGAPPAGTPNFFFSDYGTTNSVKMWKFTVNWTTPTSSTFTGPSTISVASFTKPANASVPQLGSTEKVDTLGDRLMSNFEYRNLGGVQSIWLTRSVVVGTYTGIRWMEIRNPGGTPSVYQQGTFSPDSNWRWMPSLSVDKYGNMAVGYSVSSASMYPAIRWAGRLVTDALGTLGQGEATLIAGTGSQSGGYNRWGDYASMTVDPSDGCTFWFTTEYYVTTGSNWQTRIGSFKFPGCTP